MSNIDNDIRAALRLLEKACEWLEDQACYYSHWEYNGDAYEKEIVVDTDKMIEQFKNYMENESEN